MTDNPGTSRRRVGPVEVVARVPNIYITQYLAARRNTHPMKYETVFRSANVVIRVGTRAIQSEEKSSQRKSGRSSRQSNSQDKGSKNG
jgi:hypothetical protein